MNEVQARNFSTKPSARRGRPSAKCSWGRRSACQGRVAAPRSRGRQTVWTVEALRRSEVRRPRAPCASRWLSAPVNRRFAALWSYGCTRLYTLALRRTTLYDPYGKYQQRGRCPQLSLTSFRAPQVVNATSRLVLPHRAAWLRPSRQERSWSPPAAPGNPQLGSACAEAAAPAVFAGFLR